MPLFEAHGTCIVSQMMKHFGEHSILADGQHDFRKQRSCEMQLIGLTQELHERLEKKHKST